ncbi:D-alanyl-D-alanine carboxypeptidase [Alphaproteobacteria bacterium]|nr:D-alanyl-D-alanine carboxypeptidase [Alphaproteobacteria bacterium]
MLKKVLFLSVLSLSVIISDCDARRPKGKSAKVTQQLPAKEKKNPQRVARANITRDNIQEIGAAQMILVDFDGERLFEKNADERCVPSSMTKLMTAYLLFEAIENGSLKLEDELPVSELAQGKEGSRSFFKAGTLAKVEDLVRSIVVHSGNDACTIVAEKISGSDDAFAELMNQKAETFGLQNTHFMNSTGLPDENHYSCASDLTTIAKRLISDFPQYYHYFSEKTFTVNDITQHNRNTLLGNSMNVDGLKTGKTDAGGFGIVVSAKKDGKRLICVVNGCKSMKERAFEANKILSIGFAEFMPVTIAASYKAVGSAKVSIGKSDTVGVCTHEDIVVSILKKYKGNIVVELSLDEPVEAPIVAGNKLGTMVFKYGTFVSKPYDVFAIEGVEKLTFWERVKAFMFKRDAEPTNAPKS